MERNKIQRGLRKFLFVYFFQHQKAILSVSFFIDKYGYNIDPIMFSAFTFMIHTYKWSDKSGKVIENPLYRYLGVTDRMRQKKSKEKNILLLLRH